MTPDKNFYAKNIIVSFVVLTLLIGCGGITVKSFPTADEQYQAAFQEYQKNHYMKAIDGFQKVIYNFSGSSKVDSAQYFLAMSYYGQKDYFLAAAEFERLVNNYPGSRFVDDGQYMSGLCYFKASPANHGLDQEELIRAIDALQDFITDNPESDLADDARTAIQVANERLAKKRYENGRMYLKLGYYDAAQVYFQTVIDEHTSTDWAAKALYYLGEIDYRQKRYQEAKTRFENFMIVYPGHEFSQKASGMLAKIENNLEKASTDQ